MTNEESFLSDQNQEQNQELIPNGNQPGPEPEQRPKVKPKLGIWVLVNVLIGVAVIFGLMLSIDRYIFLHTSDEKTAFYLSMLASNSLFVILILIIKLDKKLSWAELGWNKTRLKAGLIDVLKVWLLATLIEFLYMAFLVYRGVTPPENPLNQLLQRPSPLALLLNIAFIAIAAPFIEETLFRGLLFGSLRTYMGTWTAIVISAAIFSALHLELIGFVPRFVLGVGLGYLYVKHNSLYPSIGLHGLNNLLAVLLVSSFY
jgi:membrane protease YdiL (CAAX protease family)